MYKSEVEKREEQTVYGLEQFQRMILGFMPGGHVVEGFLNYRSGLKQKRILDFAESLKSVFEDELNLKLDNYNFESVDFVDIFDSVMNKVQLTKSEYKMERYRNILVNHMIDPVQDILTLKYIELLDSINEVQLVILNETPTREQIISFKRMITRLSEEEFGNLADSMLENGSAKILISNQPVTIHLDDIDFYINDLVSKGLIDKRTEEQVQNVPALGGDLKESYSITTYKVSKTGIKFLNFIRNND
jgi:hypothetical protein